ncbi:hypothetical protein [Enterobacter phage vB-EclM_KMB20]|nr:hypothetical protein [Enterobacter phage vB-EclM_KMB20]
MLGQMTEPNDFIIASTEGLEYNLPYEVKISKLSEAGRVVK